MNPDGMVALLNYRVRLLVVFILRLLIAFNIQEDGVTRE